MALIQAIPCLLKLRVNPCYAILMEQWVQVPMRDLASYVDKVNRLIEDHDKQTQELSDIRALADIIEQTWKNRLDRLTDYILDQHPSSTKYTYGLTKAYEIMKGNYE